jgi:hypothetical protein
MAVAKARALLDETRHYRATLDELHSTLSNELEMRVWPLRQSEIPATPGELPDDNAATGGNP